MARRRKKTAAAKLLPVLLPAALFALVLVWSALENRDFEITFYRMESSRLQEPLRVVLLSDLHNREFGEDNNRLVQAVADLSPDLILMTGDMVSDDSPDVSIVTGLCRRLLETAPIYYVLGNHEANLMYLPGGYQIALDKNLLDIGVNVLYYEGTDITVGGNRIRITVPGDTAGEDNPDVFRISLAHYPFEFCSESGAGNYDLAAAGHYHGGQIRLPGGRGLYAYETGFFPEYCWGKHQMSDGVLIISRGLGNHGWLPRINNPPELIVVDISRS